jgi:RNA recognition motif-containing protein
VRDATPACCPQPDSAPRKLKGPTNTLFIGNLPYSTTGDELREILSVYGPMTRVAIGPSLNPHTRLRNDCCVLTCSPKAAGVLPT